MPSVNPGPSVSISGQAVAVLSPVPSGPPVNPYPQGVAALRCIAVYKAMPLSSAGELQIPIINASAWAPVSVAFGNALVNGVSGSVAAANVGVFTATGGGGSGLRAQGVLTGQTSSTVFTTAAAAAGTAIQFNSQALFVPITATVAGGTVDVYVYGYDLSPFQYP